MIALKLCSPPIEKFSFSSSLRLKNRSFSQTECAFAFKLAGVINYTTIYTIDKIFFIFENVAFSLSLNLEIAYSEKLRLKPVAQRQEMVIGTLALLNSLFMVAF